MDTGLADASDSALTGDHSMAEAGAAVSESLVLDFADTDKLSWPVTGNIVLGYCMDTTTYFPTLDQYKVNPANVIQSEVSIPGIGLRRTPEWSLLGQTRRSVIMLISIWETAILPSAAS